MALYTPPPFSSSSLLPNELVHACNFAPIHKLAEPLTPPVSTHLPSIRHFDMEPEFDEDDSMSEDEESKPSPLSDWFSTSHCRAQSFGHIAEKTCEMVCYLWFSTNSTSSRRHHFVPETSSSTASLQFCVSQNFVNFMQKVLETTQVSQSVIVLSLHYIYRLKERNRLTNGESGSEFRVAIAALMMANKFVDDNTYTNKTWSEVSGIPLTEVNKMEREILLGIDFSLYVDKATYESWLNLLNGLCMAKEKDSLHWRTSSSSRSRLPRGSVPSNVYSSANRSAYSTPSRTKVSHRARSTSPPMQSFRYPFTFTAPNPTNIPSYSSCDNPAKPGAKRSAADAFSPTTTSCPPAKAPKRQMGVPALSLSIPTTHLPTPNTSLQPSSGSPNAQRTSHSPHDTLGLHHFSKLTLANSPATALSGHADTQKEQPMWVSSERQHVPPKTLSASWTQDRGSNWVAPQNLYYYSLACSPASREDQRAERSDSQDSISVAKKAKLRYHPAPQAKPSSLEKNPGAPTRDAVVFASHSANRLPMAVQSASTSPNMRETWLDYRQPSYQSSRSHPSLNSHTSYYQHSPTRISIASSSSTPSSLSISTPNSAPSNNMGMQVPPTLPGFNELVSGADVAAPYPSAYSYGSQSYNNSPMQPRVVDHSNGLQAAPFANAGPPGVHHYGYPYGGMDFQPYANSYGSAYSQGYAGQTSGWVRTR